MSDPVFVHDGPTAIDPRVARGPLTPVENLRPATNMQRVLILDGPTPMMADLAAGEFRRFEHGPPVSVPMVSTTFDLGEFQRFLVQVLRDPRPSSSASTLWSLHVGVTGSTLDVVEERGGVMAVALDGRQVASGPIGGSPAVVVELAAARAAGQLRVGITARNAESATGLSTELSVSAATGSVLTVGGPSTQVTGTRGRRRMTPVLVEAVRQPEPVDQFRRVLRGVRRRAGSIRRRLR